MPPNNNLDLNASDVLAYYLLAEEHTAVRCRHGRGPEDTPRVFRRHYRRVLNVVIGDGGRLLRYALICEISLTSSFF